MSADDHRHAWDRAHDFATQHPLCVTPEQFADEYQAAIDDLRNELRYPDLPDPTPAEFADSSLYL
ncbi:hypothetical protein G3N18_02035 [Microbacterium sp. 2C]|uniref:hypothetical protein n=1 Tax=Microbacterium paulum TaxID=2707006 RepID=UPI0018C2FDCA|nr:hypothetical protein [Microbacterium paulum]MBG0716867.1 hypothetical protein [Microbacterium paulum]